MLRLAFIVSHPIQYYVPLYRRLAKRDDLQIKVFFTWHAGKKAQFDPGFEKTVAWDIPLVDGYEYEVVPNTASRPGTDHFLGLYNPSLIRDILAWKPDVVHLTGYAYRSHLNAMRTLAKQGVPVLFRGDSHMLGQRQKGPRWRLKRTLLTKVYSWPSAFLYVGHANREYYRTFGVPEEKLLYCPHSIEVERFAEPELEWETQARAWRHQLQIPDDVRVLLFAGKFDDNKRAIPLMNAFLKGAPPRMKLIMVGDGVRGKEVRELAARHPEHFCVLPFQNQSRMPIVYRLGDGIVLASASESWGMAVNEAMACGRQVLVSDRVGSHADIIRSGVNGQIFRTDDWADFCKKLESIPLSGDDVHRQEMKTWAKKWSIERTEESLVKASRLLIAKTR